MRPPSDVDPVPTVAAGAGSRPPRIVVLLAATVVLTALVQALLLQSVVVASDDLHPFVEAGDRVLVWKAAPDPGAGDLVVIDTTDTAEVGRATPVDDGPLGRLLSSVAGMFGVDIGMQHRLGVLGSADGAQVDLTAPQEACVPRDDIVGTAVLRVWPLDRFGRFDQDAR